MAATAEAKARIRGLNNKINLNNIRRTSTDGSTRLGDTIFHQITSFYSPTSLVWTIIRLLDLATRAKISSALTLNIGILLEE